jgi:hypothetical protein
MMLESTDIEQREHWVRPVKKSYLEEAGLQARTTIPRFDENGVYQRCECARDNHGHTGAHPEF